MTSPEIPEHPTEPFDGTWMSDEQVKSLNRVQFMWADLTEAQTLLWADNAEEWVPPPLENKPDRIPAPDQLDQIRGLFDWIDAMAGYVRRPGGMAWIEIELMLASLGQFMDWARSNPPIDSHYRYRIDAPRDPDDSEVPDHLPTDWEEEP
jgi:hypothetical protein